MGGTEDRRCWLATSGSQGRNRITKIKIKSNQIKTNNSVTDLFQTLFLHLVPDRQDRPRLDSANVGVAVGLL